MARFHNVSEIVEGEFGPERRQRQVPFTPEEEAAWDQQEAAKKPRPIPGAEFLGRVTDAEYSSITAAARQNAKIGRWLEILRMRGEIDVASKTAQEAKDGLVAAGLLTQVRADAIFAAR